jgi:hypothetical protein
MQGYKTEFTDTSKPAYWRNFEAYLMASTNDYSTYVSHMYSELQKHDGMLNPYYCYKSGVDTLHFMTKEKHDKFINKWSNYEHIE